MLDITGWTADEIQTGAALMTELGQFDAGGQALYDPRSGERGRWDWSGDTARRPSTVSHPHQSGTCVNGPSACSS